MTDRTCNVDGCERPTRTGSAEVCNAHYFRIRRHGHPGTGQIGGRLPCSVEGCEAPTYSHGMCRPHRYRLVRYGDPHYQRPAKVCSVDGCQRAHRTQGWCDLHFQRWKAHGDPTVTADQSAEGNPNWRGDDIGYGQAHHRVRTQRGRATDHACAHQCGRLARHWAYNHTDPDELIEDGMPYSLDPAHYLPLCVSCHKVFDLAA